jgi:pimeloyl-ACP methyl ester carboxylesterase
MMSKLQNHLFYTSSSAVMTEKPTLVLIPGLLCSPDLWREQISGLKDIVNIIVADHTLDDSMEGIAARILDNAPEKFALAGLSMGGYIAQEVVWQAPERVTHLAILDSRSVPDTPDERQKRYDFLQLVDKGSFKGVTRNLLPVLIHESRLEDEELVARIFKMADDVGKEAYKRQIKAILDRENYWERLKTISCPTLVLAGAEDKIIPVSMQRDMAAEIPGAEFVTIPHCGHLPTMEEPEKTNAHLRDWLNRTA